MSARAKYHYKDKYWKVTFMDFHNNKKERFYRTSHETEALARAENLSGFHKFLKCEKVLKEEYEQGVSSKPTAGRLMPNR